MAEATRHRDLRDLDPGARRLLHAVHAAEPETHARLSAVAGCLGCAAARAHGRGRDRVVDDVASTSASRCLPTAPRVAAPCTIRGVSERVSRLRILALEPYYGGSHRAVLDGLVKRIDADWTLLTLPARKWKWRMRGAAITMARAGARAGGSAAASSRARGRSTSSSHRRSSTSRSFGDWRVANLGRSGDRLLPREPARLPQPAHRRVGLPVPADQHHHARCRRGLRLQHAWNLEQFVAAIPGFFREFPDQHPGVSPSASPRSRRVIAPPFDPAAFDAAPPHSGPRCRDRLAPPMGARQEPRGVLLGGHARWPARGSTSRSWSRVRASARPTGSCAMLPRRSGVGSCTAPSRQPRGRYAALLASADVAVSTADERVLRAGDGRGVLLPARRPLVPDRLAYPEIYAPIHRYDGADELVARLRGLVLHRPEPLAARALAERFTFERLAPAYEACFAEVAGA